MVKNLHVYATAFSVWKDDVAQYAEHVLVLNLSLSQGSIKACWSYRLSPRDSVLQRANNESTCSVYLSEYFKSIVSLFHQLILQ